MESNEIRQIKVLCVEDEFLIALDFQGAIDRELDMKCVGCLGRADKLVEEVAAKLPDILLLDLSMPGRDPLDALRELAPLYPDTRALVCSGYSDQDSMDRAFEAGAWGFVQKNGEMDEIIDSIRRVAAGEFELRKFQR